MRLSHLDDMTRGWFVGDFDPTMVRTSDVEVAVKRYAAGEYEARHYHKLATETTCIVAGEARMAGRDVSAGDIIVLEPYEATDFLAVTDVVLVAVKVPGAKNDKYEDPC